MEADKNLVEKDIESNFRFTGGKMKAHTIPVVSYVVLFFCLMYGNSALAQNVKNNSVHANPCSQDKTIRAQLIRETESGVKQYRVQRIEIWGNVFVHDRTIRAKMFLKEGDIFTGELLKESLKNIGNIKELKPVKLENVKIALDKNEAFVYLILCVIERKRN